MAGGDEAGDRRLVALRRRLRDELSRLAEQAHRYAPGASATIISLSLGHELYLGGHGPLADDFVGLISTAHGSIPTRVLLVPTIAGAAGGGIDDEPKPPASLVRLTMGDAAIVVPLRSGGGDVVGSLSLYAASAALLPAPDNASFDEVVAQLGRAASSIRTVAAAELTSVLIRRRSRE